MNNTSSVHNISKVPLWQPLPDDIASSNMTKFIEYVISITKNKIQNYTELYDWSVENIEQFWSILLDYSRIKLSKHYHSVLKQNIDTIERAKWFDGAMLNFAENLLRFKDDRTAIISWVEGRKPVYISYSELYFSVAKCVEGFKKLGLRKGDRVAALISNIPEAVIAMLAVTSLGGIWSSTSPDFGYKGVLDRFSQIQPNFLIAVDGYQYNGEKYDITDTIKNIQEQLPQLVKTVIIPAIPNTRMNFINNFILWNDLCNNDSVSLDFVQCDFNHPVYIMYSSGTTGIPKCIVHGAGGTLLQHYKELALHTNLTRDDVIMYYTTCGWMMWNWLVSSLFVGAAVFLFEGSPVYPNIGILWTAVQKEGISVFGTSPKFLTTCQKTGIEPGLQYDFKSLNAILSTGSPLSDDNFKYVYNQIKSDVRLSSISGGTDIISCFMLGNPNLPVYSEEIQCRGLGMKVEAWDDNETSLIDEKGELVCTAPFPSMPVSFWNDADGSKYHSAYFDFYPGVWRHGDFIKITMRGGITVYGRSDATLNPGGVRIGTAEIYRIVEGMEEISDSIVIGQNWNNDIRVILFVVLKSQIKLGDELIKKIKNSIREGLSPRHVPYRILQISEVPTTINGKKVEIAVTKILNGEKVKNLDVLANPDSLRQFEGMKIL